MKGLEITTTAKIDFSADRWELFDLPGRDEAAKALNEALQAAINAPGSTESSVHQAMRSVRSKYAHLGADDSEADHLIENVADKIYGDR